MRPLTFLLILALIGCNGSSPTEPQAPQKTGFPVAGATIDMASVRVTTFAGGSYRIDLGCDINTGSGTGFMNVSHPDYRNASLAYRYEHLAPPQRHDVTLTRR